MSDVLDHPQTDDLPLSLHILGTNDLSFTDDLAPARGIITAFLLGCLMWAITAAIVIKSLL